MTEEQIEILLSEGSYENTSLNGELIETHISWVILTENYVFKIKKPMQYSFLDFSSLEQRRFYCERELRLNRRFSSIYLNVVPIKEENGRLKIGEGEGDIIDYAVQMNRMNSQAKMDLCLKQEAVDMEHISALAKMIAGFHQNAEIIRTPFDKEKSKNDFNDILGSNEWVSSNLGEPYSTIIETATQQSDLFLDRYEERIIRRIADGFQRDVHGDLHSKNIFLEEEGPVIFDCIEFNDDFRRIDLLNELAFFCMDLESYDRAGLSERFMNEYQNFFPCMEDKTDKLLFTYYKAYRSNIRAKVNVLRAQQATSSTELEAISLEIKKYLKLMDKYIRVLVENQS